MESFDSSFFDAIFDRKGTGSVKYNTHLCNSEDNNIIPMWVADMDFRVPPAVQNALFSLTEHGIFGYTETDSEYDAAFCDWYRRRINWNIKPEWNIQMPGVMFGISSTIRAITNTGDRILICQPVYHPFAKIISANQRYPVISELRLTEGRYKIDFEDFEEKILLNKVKMFLLCSPHNPVGRVWTEKELREIGRICVKHNVIIVSDEIHSDFVYMGYRHIPIMSLSDELADRTITCTSPTKTFNLAGLQAANIIVPNPLLRNKIRKAGYATGYSNLNTMAIAATKAAYLYGEEWFDGLLAYLQENIEMVRNAFPNDGDITLIDPEGTYLTWLDCRRLSLIDSELEKIFLKKAGVWLFGGTVFGAGGSGFMRMNIACSRLILKTAIDKIKQAIKSKE